jgi:ERF superfamily
MSEETKTPEAPKRTLAQKILDIQEKVAVVKKRGKFGTDMGGSSYLRIEDAVVAVNKLLSGNKLILTGTLRSSLRTAHERVGKDGNLGRSGYISEVLMDWTVEDTESGEHRTWTFPGDGYDGTDKSIYKAMTGCRKYAIIIIFNLAIGNDVEEHGMTFEEGKAKQKDVVNKTLAQKANSDDPKVRKIAVDALTQVEPEKKIIISRPEEYNGHYIKVAGLLAVPQIEQYLLDTDSKRFQLKDKSVYWRVAAEYERGLIETAMKLNIDIEG